MKTILLYAFLGTIIISCNSNKEKKATDGKNSVTNKETDAISDEVNISFKADGALVKTRGWIVQRFLWDEKTPVPWLNITSNMHMDKRTININLNGSAPGKYILSDNEMMKNSHGVYFPDYSKIMDNYSFTSGEFNVTSVDTVKGLINGTFSGTGTNSDGKIIVITEGQLINVKLKAGVNNLRAEMDKISK